MRAAMTSTVQRLIALAAVAGVLAMVGCNGDDDGDQAPTANAGQSRTVALAAGQTTADVTLDGSGSTAANGAIAAYTWTASTAGSPDPDDVAMPTVTLGLGIHTFSLQVTDDSGAVSAADDVTINVTENQAPTANAGPDQTVFVDTAQTPASVLLNGSGSTDPDGPIVAYTWTASTAGSPDPSDIATPAVTLGEGVHTFSLEVTDDVGVVSVADAVTITVIVNLLPTADAGQDQTLSLAAGETTVDVTLDGGNSMDPDGMITAYIWTATTAGSPDPDDVVMPAVSLPTGSYTFSLEVTDDDGAVSAAEVTITVLTPVTVSNAQSTLGERSFTVEDGEVFDAEFAGQMGALTIGPFNIDSDGDGDADTAAFSLAVGNDRAGGTITVGNSCEITVLFVSVSGNAEAVDPPETSLADPCDVNEGDGSFLITVDGEVTTFTSTSPDSVDEIFNLNVDISPAYEVEPPVDLTDRPETGAAALRLLSGDILAYTITVNNMSAGDALTNAHIHTGHAVENGGVMTTLVNLPGEFGRTTDIVFPDASNGTVEVTGSLALTAEEASQLADDANAFYVNVHSQQVSSGLVRGQLRQEIALAFNAPMSGQLELPPTGQAETGFATLRLLSDDTLLYTLTVDNLLAGDVLTNAHIHPGNSFQEGDPFITLVNQPFQNDRTIDIQFDGGSTVTASILLTTDEVAALMDPDAPFYVNIHSVFLTGGVVRGQLRDTP